MRRSDYKEIIDSMESLIEDMEYNIQYFNMKMNKEALIILKDSLAKLISIKRFLTLEYLESKNDEFKSR
jgi:hypothetical protein